MKLRKLAEETLEDTSAHILIKSGIVYYPGEYVINAMLCFHEQASKDIYPKEFVEWLMYDGIIDEWKETALSDLYQYWQTNIKDK